MDQSSLDLPCNLCVKFFVRHLGAVNYLDMIVMNRSNDMIWGAYGANSVHMSVLHEYVAKSCQMAIGKYTQFSADAHVYAEMYDKLPHPADSEDDDIDEYPNTQPIVMDPANFDAEVAVFWNRSYTAKSLWANPFLFETAHFVRSAWDAYKLDNIGLATELCNSIESEDWRIACKQWLANVSFKRSMKAAV